jgi:hypothetical protein
MVMYEETLRHLNFIIIDSTRAIDLRNVLLSGSCRELIPFSVDLFKFKH